MTRFETLMFIFVAVFLLGAATVMFDEPKRVGYDCTLAEISPDVPVKYKELCRKLRAN